MINLNKLIDKAKENSITGICLVHFLTQCDHESMGFTKIKELEKYRYKTGKLLFPKHKLTLENKQKELKAKDDDFVTQPYFFDLVYGKRMGNNDKEGYKFRGRGLIQLTGKDNYKAYAAFKKKTLEEVIKYLETEEGAIDSAIYFWNTNKLNVLALKDDITAITKKINGGINGLEERKKLLLKYKKFNNIEFI